MLKISSYAEFYAELKKQKNGNQLVARKPLI